MTPLKERSGPDVRALDVPQTLMLLDRREVAAEYFLALNQKLDHLCAAG